MDKLWIRKDNTMIQRGYKYRVVTLDDGQTFILQRMLLEDYVRRGEETWTDIGFYKDSQAAISEAKKQLVKEEIVWSSDNEEVYEKFIKKHQDKKIQEPYSHGYRWP